MPLGRSRSGSSGVGLAGENVGTPATRLFEVDVSEIRSGNPSPFTSLM